MSRASQYEEDFLFLWQQVETDYCYLHATDWNRVRELHAPQVRHCTSRYQFVAFLERVLDSLCDFHVQLGENTSSSPHPVPSATDCWAEWRADQAVITAVRSGSRAARAGLRAGQVLLAVNDTPIGAAVRAVISPAADGYRSDVQQWALMRVVAGCRGAAQRLLVNKDDTEPVLVCIPVQPGPEEPVVRPRPLLAWHRLGVAPAAGYIRLHNSLGDMNLIPVFDKALGALLTASGLLLDLRDTPSGGNTTVARAIIGRFTAQEIGYQKHILCQEERRSGIRRSWLELASPRALPVYQAPVVVLVDRWTGSMGEGLAVGLGSLAPHVQVVGTAMAGLRGAVTTYHLPHTQIPFSLPTEQLHTATGIPRELYRPPTLVDETTSPRIFGRDATLRAGAHMLRAAVLRQN